MPPAAPDFQERLARARAGDEPAREELLVSVAERVLLYARARLGGSRLELEPLDLVQETFVAALQGLDGFRGERAQFLSWICSIAEHRLLDIAKRGNAQKRQPPGGLCAASALLERARASTSGPWTRAVRLERSEHLHAALASLAEDEREVVLARHFRDESLEEIARAMGRSASASRRLLARALQRLGRARELQEGA